MTNVEQFFLLSKEDLSVQKKLSEGLAAYPGSLEVREAVAENVLLPVAEEYGLPFSLEDLRTYETERKLRNLEEGEPTEDEEEYWLLDRGWEWDKTMIPEIPEKIIYESSPFN